MKKYIKYIKYVFVFIASIIFLNFIPFDLDEIWNYGFMHSIYNGLIPYKDFNMVITPFFPFLFSIPFYIFGSNLLVVNVCQALLITLVYFVLEKLFGKNANILLIILFFNYDMLYASYNFFIFFLFLLLLLMEKKNVNDYLIGIVIGLSVLTKQSIGGCLALVSLYYLFKDYKKFFKRVAGAMIPTIIFILYIFINNCYKEFFDLCIMGMFDFGKENYIGNIYVLILFFVCLGLIIYSIVKDKKNINNYYILAFSSIAIPMFDFFHFKFFLMGLLFIVIGKLSIKKINLDLLMYGCLGGLVIINMISSIDGSFTYPNDIKHFQFRYISDEHIKETKEVSNALLKYKDKNVIFLFEQSYYYKILNDIPINYFDLINTGNWGFDGSKKLYNKLEENKESVFVINRYSYVGTNQSDKTALNYVLDNGTKIDEIYNFEFYIIEGENTNKSS